MPESISKEIEKIVLNWIAGDVDPSDAMLAVSAIILVPSTPTRSPK